MRCYVLTGGASSRMGTPKTLLRLRGETFFERVVRACAPVFDEVIEVTRKDAVPLGGIRSIHESDHDGRAPIFGVERALSDMDGDRVWIVAVDYPLLSSQLLSFLTERFERSEALLLVPEWAERKQTLCAGWSRSLLGEVRRRIETNHFRLSNIAEDADLEVVPEEVIRRQISGDPLWNVNTPADLELLRERYEQQ